MQREYIENLPFSWLYRNSGNKRTKDFINKIRKDYVVQKFPLVIRKNKIWLNPRNQLRSLKTFSEIFKEKDHTLIKGFLSKKDKIIFDLGANEGFYTLIAKMKSPESKIFCFEPNLYAFKLMKRNLKENKLKSVKLINKAVTSRNGFINFEVVLGRTTIGGTKIYKKYRNKENLKKIKVKSITLKKAMKKNRVERVNLLKIDVEGSEFDILKNSVKVLDKIDKIVVEYHKAQKTKNKTLNILSKNNFKILLVDDKKYYGEIYAVNKG